MLLKFYKIWVFFIWICLIPDPSALSRKVLTADLDWDNPCFIPWLTREKQLDLKWMPKKWFDLGRYWFHNPHISLLMVRDTYIKLNYIRWIVFADYYLDTPTNTHTHALYCRSGRRRVSHPYVPAGECRIFAEKTTIKTLYVQYLISIQEFRQMSCDIAKVSF